MPGKKNYARPNNGLLTRCDCKGKPPADLTCEYFEPSGNRKDVCLFFMKEYGNHCGNIEAQKECRK